MTERLFEVRSFVSMEMDIEAAFKAGSPISVTFADGRRARIHITSVEAKVNGLYKFTGTMPDTTVEGVYGNNSQQRPQKLLAGFGMAKLL
jgi:hypothetical protein